MTSLAMTTFCFSVIYDSILVLSGKGGGWLELRSLSAGGFLFMYIKLLDWVPQTFSGV